MELLWLVLLGIAILYFISGLYSFLKRKVMTRARRGALAASSLFLAISLFMDSGSYAMVPGVGPCLTLLGALLLPLVGEGVAISARYIEFLLSFVLVAFALVALRPRRRRIVERGERPYIDEVARHS